MRKIRKKSLKRSHRRMKNKSKWTKASIERKDLTSCISKGQAQLMEKTSPKYRWARRQNKASSIQLRKLSSLSS